MLSLSLETLELCKRLLGAQQLNAGAEDFADVAEKVIVAKKELEKAIAEADMQAIAAEEK